MNSEDFIKVAGQIVAFGDAGSRSATSRAYYGAYNLAVDIVCEFAQVARVRFPRDHRIAKTCLEKSTESDARDAASVLGNLQGRRVKADYRIENTEPNSLRFGQFTVVAAQSCEGLLKSFRESCRDDESIKSQFVGAIRSVFANHSFGHLL